MKMEEATGDHGDQHYTLTLRRRGVEYTLRFASGMWFSGKDPRKGEEGWRITEWVQDGVLAVDFRLAVEGLVRRYVILHTPIGYATYGEAPPEIAARWDGVLDSVCAEKLRWGR